MLLKRIEIFNNFHGEYLLNNKDRLFSRIHRSSYYGMCAWSTFEQFSYLDCLYSMKPDLFPSLAPETYKALKKKF